MEELGIDEIIIFNFLVLIEDGDQRWIHPDDLARQKFGIFHGSWCVGSVNVSENDTLFSDSNKKG